MEGQIHICLKILLIFFIILYLKLVDMNIIY